MNITSTHRLFSGHHNVKKLLVSKEYALKVLGLKTFSNEEIRKSFKELQRTPPIDYSSSPDYDEEEAIDAEKSIAAKLQSYYSKESTTISSDELTRAAVKITALLTDRKEPAQGRNDRILLTYDEYHEKVNALGRKLDPRTSNIALSFLLAGSSVGIIIPCMPILVTQLAIPSYEFGLVNSAFGLSKLLGNIPSGYLVEEYGRKPVMIAGMGLCAVGMGSIGLSLIPGLGSPWLMGCRFLSGIGVSMFVAGGSMYISDISTALNRTQTNAPVFAAFSGGTAVGPAVGTLLIQYIGLSRTYLTVGGLFMALAAANSRLLSETAPHKVFPEESNGESKEEGKDKPKDSFLHVLRGMKDSFGVSIKSWKELKKIAPLRNIVLLNGSFWFAISGSQMTLLPLLLVSPDLHLTTPQIGGTFAAMSLISFLASQPSAYLADKYGKERGIVSGCAFVCLSATALPYATNFPELLLALFPLAIGSTVMNSTPAALVGDLSSTSQRSQALSLLRTCGDAGMVAGALFSGMAANIFSIEAALLCNSAVMAASSSIFAYYSSNFVSTSHTTTRATTTTTTSGTTSSSSSSSPSPQTSVDGKNRNSNSQSSSS